jgi:hypothetical protein
LWAAVERDRKHPWRIVGRFGVIMLVRYLSGRLTLSAAISKLGEVTGTQVAVVESRFGLAAVDVDKPTDLDFVRQLKQRPTREDTFT